MILPRFLTVSNVSTIGAIVEAACGRGLSVSKETKNMLLGDSQTPSDVDIDQHMIAIVPKKFH